MHVRMCWVQYVVAILFISSSTVHPVTLCQSSRTRTTSQHSADSNSRFASITGRLAARNATVVSAAWKKPWLT